MLRTFPYHNSQLRLAHTLTSSQFKICNMVVQEKVTCCRWPTLSNGLISLDRLFLWYIQNTVDGTNLKQMKLIRMYHTDTINPYEGLFVCVWLHAAVREAEAKEAHKDDEDDSCSCQLPSP